MEHKTILQRAIEEIQSQRNSSDTILTAGDCLGILESLLEAEENELNRLRKDGIIAACNEIRNLDDDTWRVQSKHITAYNIEEKLKSRYANSNG